MKATSIILFIGIINVLKQSKQNKGLRDRIITSNAHPSYFFICLQNTCFRVRVAQINIRINQ